MSRLDREPGITKSEDSTLLGRGYKLLDKLGDGSYAKVYLCQYTHENIQTRIACKVMDTTKASKRFVKKFLPRELTILLKLDHPHIIHIHSILRRHTKYYIFMRYAERGDVLEYVTKHGAVTERQARIWFRQLVLAVHYLHELRIAHRDLKCENLLLTANYNVKVADFGFSRQLARPAELSETYCGSLSYSAPEVLKGCPYDPQLADIWACGVILYILLNKAMPFDDTNAKRLLRMQVNRCWWFRAKIEHHLSDEVKRLVPLMLEPDCDKRPTVDKLTGCDWIAMEPDLLRLTRAEAEALIKVAEEKMTWTQSSDTSEVHSGSEANANSLEISLQLPETAQETEEPEETQPAADVQEMQETQPAADVQEMQEIQPAEDVQEMQETQPAQEVQETQETQYTEEAELETRKARKKKHVLKKKGSNHVRELKPIARPDERGSVQHKYAWQKGNREEMDFVGDGDPLPAASAAEEWGVNRNTDT